MIQTRDLLRSKLQLSSVMLRSLGMGSL